jgi:hypothetical protein
VPTVNNNHLLDTKQLWQQVEPAPTASTSVSALATSEDGTDRFIYYVVGTLFYRYDSYANTWHRLAPPIVGTYPEEDDEVEVITFAMGVLHVKTSV